MNPCVSIKQLLFCQNYAHNKVWMFGYKSFYLRMQHRTVAPEYRNCEPRRAAKGVGWNLLLLTWGGLTNGLSRLTDFPSPFLFAPELASRADALWTPKSATLIWTRANKGQGMFPWLQQTFVEEDSVTSPKSVCAGDYPGTYHIWNTSVTAPPGTSKVH